MIDRQADPGDNTFSHDKAAWLAASRAANSI